PMALTFKFYHPVILSNWGCYLFFARYSFSYSYPRTLGSTSFYSPGFKPREWVYPKRLRAVGSTDLDNIFSKYQQNIILNISIASIIKRRDGLHFIFYAIRYIQVIDKSGQSLFGNFPARPGE